jgi:magnesium-transporting ATPase (P-type)
MRGSSLKNTQFIYGIVVFTGHDTKIMQNYEKAKYKFSHLEVQMNKFIVMILLTQIGVSAIAGIIGAAWIKFVNENNLMCGEKDNWCQLERVYYLSLKEGDEKEEGFPFFVKLGTWFLIVLNIIPISLMVTKELISFVQAIFMQFDADMVDEEQGAHMCA